MIVRDARISTDLRMPSCDSSRPAPPQQPPNADTRDQAGQEEAAHQDDSKSSRQYVHSRSKTGYSAHPTPSSSLAVRPHCQDE